MQSLRILFTSTLVLYGFLWGCANPNEPAAQQLLSRAKELEADGNHLDALITAFKVSKEYPGTTAATEAASLAQVLANGGRQRKQAEDQRQSRIAAKIGVSQATLAQLGRESDDMEQISWYSDRAADKWILGKYVKFYFGISNKSGHPMLLPLRMKLHFEGSDWIFARTVTIKTGKTIHHLVPEKWRHTNSGGTVWESCDVPLSEGDKALLLDLATSDEVKIRFEGSDHYSDFIVPKKQLDALKRVYGVWKDLDSAG